MEQIAAPIIETPILESSKPIESKTFEIKSNKNNIFEITIYNNIKYIKLKGIKKDNNDSKNYLYQIDIEKIKINKYFLMFDNLKEIYDEIINLISNKNPNLIEDSNKLIISIPISTTKIKEIIFEMEEKEKTDKEKIQELYSIIKNLKSFYDNQIKELNQKIEKQNNKIEQQNIKIDQQNNKFEQQNIKIDQQNNQIEQQNKKIGQQNYKIDQQNNQIEDLNNQIEDLNNQIEDLNNNKEKQDKQMKELKNKIEEKKNNNLNIFNDSIIIKQNQTYISNLQKWISQNNIFSFKTKLLFRKSINGDSFEAFHKLCDYQGTTLVLIESTEDFIIGGYTTQNWDTSGNWYNDEKCFLFSLTKGKKFPKIKSSMHSIRGDKYNGPWFAYIGITKNNLSEGYYYYKDIKEMCFENYNDIIPNKKCERAFNVKEVEIYKIENI